MMERVSLSGWLASCFSYFATNRIEIYRSWRYYTIRYICVSLRAGELFSHLQIARISNSWPSLVSFDSGCRCTFFPSVKILFLLFRCCALYRRGYKEDATKSCSADSLTSNSTPHTQGAGRIGSGASLLK